MSSWAMSQSFTAEEAEEHYSETAAAVLCLRTWAAWTVQTGKRLNVELLLFIRTVDCGFQRHLGLKLNEKTARSPRHLSLSLLCHFKTWVFISLVVS